MTRLIRMLAGMLAIASTTTALASTYTGPALAVRIVQLPSNTTRISVLISGATSCTYAGWYSAEFADTSAAGKAWIAALLAAQARGANVSIAGTGGCDGSGLETIYFIDALP